MGNRGLIGVGRLGAGVTPGAATSELGVIGKRWISVGFVPDQGDGRLARSAVPLPAFVSGHAR